MDEGSGGITFSDRCTNSNDEALALVKTFDWTLSKYMSLIQIYVENILFTSAYTKKSSTRRQAVVLQDDREDDSMVNIGL